jgi:hypothetical protein
MTPENASMSTTKLTVPRVHLNGTGYSTLLKEYLDAAIAVRKAMTSLREVTLHQRDYYVQPSGAWRAAVAEGESRYRRLESVRDELDQIAADVFAQRQRHDARRNAFEIPALSPQ